jgi:non-heme chloroperoxidase
MTVPPITPSELAQIDKANTSGKTPVAFVHGLWLLGSSWDKWVTFFEDAGYVGVTPGWPDDPATVADARANTQAFAGKSVGDVAAYQQSFIEKLDKKPILVGHSFGGLLVQILAGRGLAAATVVIDPAPSRGVLPLPFAALKSASAVLIKPGNRKRAVTLTFEQFQYGFGNAVPEDEARKLYDEFHVAGTGEPIFQAAFANFNPKTEAKAIKTNADRGPMLVISGEKDHQVPPAISKATFKLQKKNAHAITEFATIAGRGHSLTIDSGWQEVAQTSLDFVKRFVQ